MTGEIDGHRRLGVGELPRRAEPQPVVGLFNLAPVHEGLAEDAVLVANAVTDAGHRLGGQGVDEAGSQTPQAAVAQTGLDLLGAQVSQVQPALVHGLLGDLGQPTGQQGVVQLAAQQVFGRQVAHGLRLGVAVGSR